MVQIFSNRSPDEDDKKETYYISSHCPNCQWRDSIPVYNGNEKEAHVRARNIHHGSIEARSGGGCAWGHKLVFSSLEEKKEERKPLFKFKTE